MHSIFLPSPYAAGRSVRGKVFIAAPKVRLEPVAREDWPCWAVKVAQSKKRQAADKGVGDTLVHLIGDNISVRFKRITSQMGINCGCTDRQRWFNARFPY